MKRELLHIAVVLYWAFVIGIAAPYLISAPHSELVIAGFALLLGSAYITYRWFFAPPARKPTRKSTRTKK